jgi:hypothetical protein
VRRRRSRSFTGEPFAFRAIIGYFECFRAAS